MSAKPFHFKQFIIHQDKCAMKIGTDGVLLGAWCDCSNASSILDIGTGTGVIAIMQAQRNNIAQITAIEIDATASQQASLNIKNCLWKDRLSIQNISLQDFVKDSTEKFDLITCNPPFFPNSDFTVATGKARSIARNDNTLTFSALISNAKQLMHSESKLCLIIPISEFERLKAILLKHKLHLQKVTCVKPKADKIVHRVLLQIGLKKVEIEEGILILQHERRNDFTDDYIELVKGFYTIL